MKVLYVSRSRSVHDERFIEAWRSQGVELDVLTLASSELEDEAAGRNAIDETVARFRPDVVQAGPIVDVGHLVASAWRGPFILTSWGFDLMEEVDRSDRHFRQAQVALSAASVLFTDNDIVTEQAVGLGIAPDAVVQFPWGINLDSFTPEGPSLRASLGWDGSNWVVGCTRRHEEYYDVRTVVAGFSAFAADHPQARLLLAGGGSLTPNLKAQVRELGIEDRTVFLGETGHEQLGPIYRTLDAYVSASTVDGTSVSLLEAMACRVPVSVSDIPGNRQWVTPETGLLFPVGDAEALADALGQLFCGSITSATGVETLVANARSAVEREANWEVTRQRFSEFADLAVSRHSA